MTMCAGSTILIVNETAEQGGFVVVFRRAGGG